MTTVYKAPGHRAVQPLKGVKLRSVQPTIAYYASDDADAQRWIAKQRKPSNYFVGAGK